MILNRKILGTTLAAVALVVTYSIATTLPIRDCLTMDQVATAQANAWQGVSMSCNETVRLARLEAHGPRLGGVEQAR